MEIINDEFVGRDGDSLLMNQFSAMCRFLLFSSLQFSSNELINRYILYIFRWKSIAYKVFFNRFICREYRYFSIPIFYTPFELYNRYYSLYEIKFSFFSFFFSYRTLLNFNFFRKLSSRDKKYNFDNFFEA